jgi:hypothetical protein
MCNGSRASEQWSGTLALARFDLGTSGHSGLLQIELGNLQTENGETEAACRCSIGTAMAALGQIRPFASVELHASFTLTSRHSPRQSSRRPRADAVDVRSLWVFGKNRGIADYATDRRDVECQIVKAQLKNRKMLTPVRGLQCRRQRNATRGRSEIMDTGQPYRTASAGVDGAGHTST